MKYILTTVFVFVVGIAFAQNEVPELSVEAAVASVSTPVESFSTAIVDGNPLIVGRSLEEIIETSPHYPPVEGIPDAVWKEKQCSACHLWTQEALCTQGQFYAGNDAGFLTRTRHPFGGSLKANIALWAESGCK